jgi:hypothetical protein
VLPDPPLTYLDGVHPELAVSLDEVLAALTLGLLAGCCVCGHGTGTWWPDGPPEGNSTWWALHEHCAPRLLEQWRQRIVAGDAETRSAARAPAAGAYARRASRTTSTPVRAAVQAALPSRSSGSRWWRPGMPEGTPWALLTDTNLGQIVHLDDSVRHPRDILRRFALLTEQGQPIASGGTYAAGGALFHPTGRLIEQWGSGADPDRPRWSSLSRVAQWSRCSGCAAPLWPLRLVSATGRCRACVEADEGEDPRVWPTEPTAPERLAWPEWLGGPKKRKTPARRKAADDGLD